MSAPTSEIGYANANGAGWWAPPTDEDTPELIWPLSTIVYDKMRTQDAQVRSVLRAVTLPIRRTNWRIDPAGARDEVVELVATDLGLPVDGAPEVGRSVRTRGRFSWKDHLRMALICLPVGHMFFEQVYRIEGSGRSQRARLRKLAPRMPRSLAAIKVATDGGLEAIEQVGTLAGFGVGSAQNRPIPVNRLVAYVHEREGGNWVGQSILRPAYKNWVIKDRLLRIQAQTVDRNGMGVPLYTGAEGETSLDEGRRLATEWRSGNTAGSAIPHGATLVLRGVEGALPDADKPIRYHDEQIGRAVLAHFLNLGTQTGSWALGSTFADFFTMSLQAVAEDIADTANAHVVEDLVDVNFGETEPAPRIVFDEIGSRQAATAAALKILVDAGILLPDRALEEAARQAFGLPPKEAGSPSPDPLDPTETP